MLAQVQPKLDGEDSLILNILNPCFDASYSQPIQQGQSYADRGADSISSKGVEHLLFLFGLLFSKLLCS